MHEQDVEREEDDAHAEREDGDLLRHVVELLLQGALGLAHVLREVGDLAELGVHADAGHDRATVALGDRGAREDEVGRLGRGEVVLEDGVGGLPHGIGLAREGRLVDLQVRGPDDARVGRDLVALGEEHHVTRDEVLGENLLLVAVADHIHVGREHLLQGLGRLARAVLLPEAEAAVDDVHEPDGDAELGHAGEERDEAGRPEEDCHEMREVREEGDDRRLLLDGLDEVLALFDLALLRFACGEASGSRAKCREDVVPAQLLDVHGSLKSRIYHRVPTFL